MLKFNSVFIYNLSKYNKERLMSIYINTLVVINRNRDFILEENCMKKISDNLSSQLPDLKFVRFCEEKYGINRGIYNTVDEWFYEQGIEGIVRRREIIMDFFKSLNESGNRKVTFGSKGLREKFNNYVAEEKK